MKSFASGAIVTVFFDGGRTVDVYEFDGQIVVKTSRPSEGREHPVVCIALGNGHEPGVSTTGCSGGRMHTLTPQSLQDLVDKLEGG